MKKMPREDENGKGTASEDSKVSMKLFVTGASANSVKAIGNIKSICEEYLNSKYDLEIIDVYQQPSKTREEQIIALPMLLKYFPLPVKRFIGDLSDTTKVLNGLGLNRQ